ncbi:hypothetical protein DFJ74DRAFT_664783 [Hyaloraphidium curvatum]|nr:hypothetical protein DFJ74DRAFT_664783 [Hyaloraphidium curvatum]
MLNRAEKELESQREQTELLKLQVLATKRAEWVSRAQPETRVAPQSSARPKTRDLIRRDKMAYKLKLFKIDLLETEECQEILKDVCLKLDVDDVSKILPTLNEVEAALKLLPQIQAFVGHVDSLVWDEGRGTAAKFSELGRLGAPLPARKLADTLAALADWSELVREAKQLRSFRADVHEIAGLPESSKSDRLCIEELRQHRAAADRKGRAPERIDPVDQGFARMIKHFRNLFDIPSLDAVIPRINQLYVFEAEVESGLRRLRSMLRLQTKKPSEILAESIRFVSQRLTDAPRSRHRSQEYSY